MTEGNSLAARLKKARLDQNLSLRALERMVGVSFSGLARLERNEGEPNTHTIERVEKWLADGTMSEPHSRELRGVSWLNKMELRVLYLEGIVTGLLNRLDRGATNDK
jgi:transcriptional regulator with XRE-family HTH domain